MHQWFTWGSLVSGLVVAAIIYYTGWFILFGLKKRNNGNLPKVPTVWSRTTAPVIPEPTMTASSSPMSLVHDLMEELKTVWVAAKKESLDQEQVASAIRHCLVRYASLKGSPLQGSVNHHIIQECQKATAVELTEEEISVLW